MCIFLATLDIRRFTMESNDPNIDNDEAALIQEGRSSFIPKHCRRNFCLSYTCLKHLLRIAYLCVVFAAIAFCVVILRADYIEEAPWYCRIYQTVTAGLMLIVIGIIACDFYRVNQLKLVALTRRKSKSIACTCAGGT